LRNNKSGYANESESEGGVEKGSVTWNGGYTTSPQWPHVSPVSASGIGTVIGIVTVTVLGRESEIGIGHLVVVVGTAVRVVRAVEAVEVVAGIVEATATATATGHWLREWDFEILLSGLRKPPTRSDGPT
jgi:hypothetical protein